MLYRLRDVMDEVAGGYGSLQDGHDSRLLLFPAGFNTAFREPVRCLRGPP
jgi:hypothetical protein